MPKRYWRDPPETRDIAGLAPRVAAKGAPRSIAREWTAHGSPLERGAASGPDTCRACPLWKRATQAVRGEGPRRARVMLVGEQPGDEEDLQGRPFVGPAGKVLDRALERAGLAREAVFLTNAVKHFSWTPRGKRRMHKTPAQREIEACERWLDEEVARVSPRVIVALGASALFALTGKKLPVGATRGRLLAHRSGAALLATYHPSAVLRALDDRERIFEALCEDLAAARHAAAD